MRATLVLFLVAAACAALLPGCSRGRGAAAPAPQPAPGPQQPGAEPEASPEAPAVPSAFLRFVPSQSRVLMRGDSDEIVMQWMPVGMTLESAQGQVLHGLLLAETSIGEEVLSPLSQVGVLSATGWERGAGAYRRSYAVRSLDAGSPVSGTVDSAQCLLVTAESGGLSAGFLERRISVDGGESDYNVLAVVADGAVTLVDTSVWVFPESFHPSGVRGVTIGDVNGDGSPEIVVSVETIVSLNYLGATPLAWECWLPARSPASGPLFQFNESFATDEGSSYTASRRLVDSDGDGVRETVKVTTEVEEASEEREFTNAIVSFYLWDGSRYAKQAADELPRLGSVAVERATLFADTSIESGSVAEAAQGELLYVFDRSDSPPFWFRAVTKQGVEGWIAGSEVQLAWVDPLKVNREVFLSQ
jgi:hypothetical protein